MKVRSLFISDCHIGSEHCNHKKLLQLLSNVECEYLYIVGDFIDGWLLSRKFKWNNDYNTILQKILRLSRKGTKVYYIWGNHDDFVEPFTGLHFGDNVAVTRQTIHITSKNESILILHGDQFDGIVTKNKWIQHIGAIIYDCSLSVNKLCRIFKFSFSNFLKQKAKEAVKYIGNYELTIVNYCKSNNCNIILCGHIHKPEYKIIDDITYINTGDWVENNTFVIETVEGDIKLIKYEDIIWGAN
jgi:UDP-2,3-diacylglucosamine pyrophosphatase LpxH